MEKRLEERPIFGGLGVWRQSTGAERVRDSFSDWIVSMQFSEFGTLTLRTAHGKSCAERHCDGITIRGTPDCRVPGMQKTAKLVNTFRHLCRRSFVVEEYGSDKGRRHFHFVGDDAAKIRRGKRGCIRCLELKCHTRHNDGYTAVGWWLAQSHSAEVETVYSPRKAADYVTKEISDDYEFWNESDVDVRNDERNEFRKRGRIWVGRPERPALVDGRYAAGRRCRGAVGSSCHLWHFSGSER